MNTDETDRSSQAAVRATWAAALAGVQLVGAAEVVAAAESIDSKSRDRYQPTMAELVGMLDAQTTDEEPTAAAQMEKLDAGLRRIIEGSDENKTLQLALVDACRRSLAATE
jgi:hypothetical protein